MMITHRYDDESYQCYFCDKELDESEIVEWGCGYCNERVAITCSTMTGTYMRKKPEEVFEGDDVLLPNGYHEVFGVKCNKEKYYFNLKGHGSWMKRDYDWINVRYYSI